MAQQTIVEHLCLTATLPNDAADLLQVSTHDDRDHVPAMYLARHLHRSKSLLRPTYFSDRRIAMHVSVPVSELDSPIASGHRYQLAGQEVAGAWSLARQDASAITKMVTIPIVAGRDVSKYGAVC